MHHDTTRTGDLNIAKMKIVASLGENLGNLGFSWLQGFASRTRGTASVSTPNVRDLRTNLYRIPKTVLYTDFNTLRIQYGCIPLPHISTVFFGYPATKVCPISPLYCV
jgi:hypothetical protein